MKYDIEEIGEINRLMMYMSICSSRKSSREFEKKGI